MLALSPVPFQGQEDMTVQERVKFVGSFRFFHPMLGQQFLVIAKEAGLCVGS